MDQMYPELAQLFARSRLEERTCSDGLILLNSYPRTLTSEIAPRQSLYFLKILRMPATRRRMIGSPTMFNAILRYPRRPSFRSAHRGSGGSISASPVQTSFSPCSRATLPIHHSRAAGHPHEFPSTSPWQFHAVPDSKSLRDEDITHGFHIARPEQESARLRARS